MARKMRGADAGEVVPGTRIGVRERKEWTNAEAQRTQRNNRKERRKTHPCMKQTRKDGAPGRDRKSKRKARV